MNSVKFPFSVPLSSHIEGKSQNLGTPLSFCPTKSIVIATSSDVRGLLESPFKTPPWINPQG